MIREATIDDVPTLLHLRMQVHENVLSDPGLVTGEMVAEAITTKGQGWVFEEADQILGFSIAYQEDPSIWALFVLPGQEGRGIGHGLHEAAVNWLWSKGIDRIWLCTEPKTRAERFYRDRGWHETGTQDGGDIRFELKKS